MEPAYIFYKELPTDEEIIFSLIVQKKIEKSRKCKIFKISTIWSDWNDNYTRYCGF